MVMATRAQEAHKEDISAKTSAQPFHPTGQIFPTEHRQAVFTIFAPFVPAGSRLNREDWF
jgi:hypothetical protein